MIRPWVARRRLDAFNEELAPEGVQTIGWHSEQASRVLADILVFACDATSQAGSWAASGQAVPLASCEELALHRFRAGTPGIIKKLAGRVVRKLMPETDSEGWLVPCPRDPPNRYLWTAHGNGSGAPLRMQLLYWPL